MIAIKYKTNAQKCIESNAIAYKHKPVYVGARKTKRMMKELDSKWSGWKKDIDFKMF